MPTKKIWITEDKGRGPWLLIPLEVLVYHRELQDWIRPEDHEWGENMTIDFCLTVAAMAIKIGGDWSPWGIDSKSWGILEEDSDLRELGESRRCLLRKMRYKMLEAAVLPILKELHLMKAESKNSSGSPKNSPGDLTSSEAAPSTAKTASPPPDLSEDATSAPTAGATEVSADSTTPAGTNGSARI